MSTDTLGRLPSSVREDPFDPARSLTRVPSLAESLSIGIHMIVRGSVPERRVPRRWTLEAAWMGGVP